MPITTQIDGSTAIKYTAGTDLTALAKQYGTTVDKLLVFADRNDDSLEGGVTPLAVGDVIIIKGKENNNTNPQQPTADAKKDEEPVFTEEKVTGAIAGIAGGALGGAALGAKFGAIGGPLGIAAGCVIGGLIGWWIGDACD